MQFRLVQLGVLQQAADGARGDRVHGVAASGRRYELLDGVLVHGGARMLGRHGVFEREAFGQFDVGLTQAQLKVARLAVRH